MADKFCSEHKGLVRGIELLTALVLLVLGSIWYQNIFLFPELKQRVTEQITAIKSDVATLEGKVAELKEIHPMGEKK